MFNAQVGVRREALVPGSPVFVEETWLDETCSAGCAAVQGTNILFVPFLTKPF